MITKIPEWKKSKNLGYPKAVVDNFLDENICLSIYDECINAPKGGWTVFTRADSRMEEFNDLLHTPIAHKVVYNTLYSGEFIYELEQLTGIVGLLPDPHLVGAGFSIIRNNSTLAPHYDFNWNDRLRLHRKLTGIIFITPNWKSEYGGHNLTWDQNPELVEKAKIVDRVEPIFNRLLLTENFTRGPIHSVSQVKHPDNFLGRCALRFFYYISTSEHNPDDPPHKSIYSSNDYTHDKLIEEEWEGNLVGNERL